MLSNHMSLFKGREIDVVMIKEKLILYNLIMPEKKENKTQIVRRKRLLFITI